MPTTRGSPVESAPPNGETSGLSASRESLSSRIPLPSASTGFTSVIELEDALSWPSRALVEAMERIRGDVMLLGVGGKMGPTMARMARRAADLAGSPRRVIGVSRFSRPGGHEWLRQWGVETIGGDLLEKKFVRSLPDADNIVYLVGRKFGARGSSAQTWALNAYLPGLIADRFAASRIVALSTGNVYGLTPVNGLGAAEADDAHPVGEYAMSVLGRERVFEHFCLTRGTPTAIIRLNYATELRYGVMVDLALKVFREEPISLEMGYFNAIWQRDANDMILRSLEHASRPPLVLNVTGPERVSCRETSQHFGQLFDRRARLVGTESDTALLSDARLAIELFGPPEMTVQDMHHWIAQWILQGGEIWDVPTRFEVRDGNF